MAAKAISFVNEKLPNKMKKLPDCEVCNKAKATAGYCVVCCQVLCTLCDDVHKQLSSTSNHKLVNIEERSSTSPVRKCFVHDNQPLDLYCVTCEQLICYHCTIIGHKEHIYDVVDKVCKKEKKKLTARMEKLTEKKIELAKIKEQSQANQRHIVCKRDLIEKAFEISKQQLRKSSEKKLKLEKKHERSVVTCLDELIDCEQQVQQCVHKQTPTQLLSTKKQMMARIENLMTSSVEFELNKPLEELIGYDDEEKLQQFVLETMNKMFANIFFTENRPRSEKFSYKFRSISIPDYILRDCLCSETSGVFQVLFHGQPMKIDKSNISCAFSSTVYDDDNGDYEFEIECDVQVVNHCDQPAYEITFTPTSGFYTFTLEVSGVKINTEHTLTVDEVTLDDWAN